MSATAIQHRKPHRRPHRVSRGYEIVKPNGSGIYRANYDGQVSKCKISEEWGVNKKTGATVFDFWDKKKKEWIQVEDQDLKFFNHFSRNNN